MATDETENNRGTINCSRGGDCCSDSKDITKGVIGVVELSQRFVRDSSKDVVQKEFSM
jgi:hypothetical protein